MTFWPFGRKKRRKSKDASTQPLNEKAPPEKPTRAATYPSTEPTQPIPIPRRSSKRGSPRKRRASQEVGDKQVEVSEKENVHPRVQHSRSREDITALPMSRTLQHSPHLRPVDLEKPQIPYTFHQYSTSQTSVQREDAMASPRRPNTLKKRRSNYESDTPQRRQSSRRRKDDHVREEEIRAMSAQVQIPKRAGEGPLRRESKKMRSLGMKDSDVSLPQEDSVHSPMSSIMEQHGWEIGSLDVFNPRPAVRLSGTPQYVSSPGSLPRIRSSSPVQPLLSEKEKQKMPVSRDSAKKLDTIGSRADDLDASDIRALMERDAKRREQRKKKDQEKLDRKLRNRAGRNRGDSDRKRREAEDARKAEDTKQREEGARRGDEIRQREEAEQRQREVMTPPTDIHPALRKADDDHEQHGVGLGIGESETVAGAAEMEQDTSRDVDPTEAQDPFADPTPEQVATPSPDLGVSVPGAFQEIETPMEDPVVATAKEIRMSQASTPPLSPVYSPRSGSSIPQAMESRRVSDLQPPPTIPESRRASDPKPERRAGTWAAFFRRGGTNLRKGDEARSPPSEHSFSNTSRESMRNQPLPAHLVDTQVQPSIDTRRKSGTPVRTQSRFREDLPELPISPPDSRVASPDATTAAAAFRRAQRSPVPIDISRQSGMADSSRNDTPVSPSLRGRNVMSSSMASVDSEGSWLASGSGQRHSAQSALSKRRPEFSASYEDLGGDTDPQHFSRSTPTPEAKRGSLDPRIGSSVMPAPTEEASEADYIDAEQYNSREPRPDSQDSTGEPLAVHESVRRKPTLVHRDPRVKSREGLLAEYSGEVESPLPTSAGTGKGSMDLDFDPEEPEPDLRRASSVNYGKGHARQVSAGSAKLLDVPPRRASTDIRSDSSEPPTPRL